MKFGIRQSLTYMDSLSKTEEHDGIFVVWRAYLSHTVYRFRKKGTNKTILTTTNCLAKPFEVAERNEAEGDVNEDLVGLELVSQAPFRVFAREKMGNERALNVVWLSTSHSRQFVKGCEGICFIPSIVD